MQKVILSIEGMTCSACSSGLEKYLNKQKGVEQASVNLVMANASIEYDDQILDIPQLEMFVKQAGFKSLGEFKEIQQDAYRKNEKVKLIIFTVLSIVLMYISMGHMIHLPTSPWMDRHLFPTNYAISLCILTIPFLFYGFDILKNGYKNLVHGTPNMDTLVGIGVFSSFVFSLYSMAMVVRGDSYHVQNLYFESSAIVIYFIKLGRYLDGMSKDKTKEAIQKLVEITPHHAIVKREGKETIVTLDEIKKGDVLICKPGEKIAVDGTIIQGQAHLDEAFITGESMPAKKSVGDTVVAGSVNYDGYIEYCAERIGKESTVSGIVKLVMEASNTKAPIAKVADTVSGYFVPVVMVVAVITLLAYVITGHTFADSLVRFVTVLVVACPCSLGLATPLAMVVSQGLCASNGILVKENEVLENASKMNTIVFDKTGTLTYGKLKIASMINYSNIEDAMLLQLVGSIEAKSTHPIANTFTDAMKEQHLQILPVEDFANKSGYGLIGTIQGDKIIVGNRKLLEQYNIENLYKKEESDLAKQGCSIVYVAQGNKVIAIFGVNDIVKEDAKKVIQELQNQGVKAIMLTGDNQQTAQTIAEQLGIDTVIANVLPSEKTKTIKKLKEQGAQVMMCGDGINDSPALATADIGVSINSGTDIAMDSSDVVLMNEHLQSIIKLICISKKTVKNIKQNLFWAFFYNMIMIPIAMGLLRPWGIVINPMLASIAMILSSITVMLNALRLRKLRGI